MGKLSFLCKLGLHTDVVFIVKARRGVVHTRQEPYIWDEALCHECDQQLSPTKKIVKRQQEIDAEIAKIRKEIKEYGHPRITGIGL